MLDTIMIFKWKLEKKKMKQIKEYDIRYLSNNCIYFQCNFHYYVSTVVFSEWKKKKTSNVVWLGWNEHRAEHSLLRKLSNEFRQIWVKTQLIGEFNLFANILTNLLTTAKTKKKITNEWIYLFNDHWNSKTRLHDKK